jgi:hypothetical protein
MVCESMREGVCLSSTPENWESTGTRPAATAVQKELGVRFLSQIGSQIEGNKEPKWELWQCFCSFTAIVQAEAKGKGPGELVRPGRDPVTARSPEPRSDDFHRSRNKEDRGGRRERQEWKVLRVRREKHVSGAPHPHKRPLYGDSGLYRVGEECCFGLEVQVKNLILHASYRQRERGLHMIGSWRLCTYERVGGRLFGPFLPFFHGRTEQVPSWKQRASPQQSLNLPAPRFCTSWSPELEELDFCSL